VVEAPQLETGPEAGGYGPSRCSVLPRLWRSSRPFDASSGGRGRVVCCGVTRRCRRGKAGRRPCRPDHGERGKRSDGARRPFGVGAGAPSAVAVGAWRSRRSTPSQGEPGTWGRAAANAQHVWTRGGRW
jgi:hypothetical protein